MIGRREQRRERGIALERTNRPVGVLGIPTGNHRIVVGHARQRIDTGRPRGIGVEPIFQDSSARLLIPEPVIARGSGAVLPEQRRRIGLWCAHEVLHLGHLARHLDRVVGGRRIGAHLRSEEHTSELQSHHDIVCRLLLEKKKKKKKKNTTTTKKKKNKKQK